MWTPRRILFFLTGIAAFGVAYIGYGLFLGGIDGLPVLPSRYLEAASAEFVDIVIPRTSPVESRIEQAFGANCPELIDPAYKTKLDFRDKGLVLATGPMPEIKEPTKRVRISPVSIAVFSKPAPNAKPDAIPEIVTLHADEAILEYERPITSRTEMLQEQVRLVGIELLGNPESESRDARKGRVIITHNQKSHDPGRWLFVRTPGPVFYRAPEPGKPPSPDIPTVRTAAAVEVENRANAPRPLWGQRLSAVAASGDDLRMTNAVSDIVFGRRAPPPTATAIGLKMYFAAETPAPVKPGAKPASTQTKLREIQFGESVQFNVWLEKTSGFPGSGNASAPPPKKVLDSEPPFGFAAVAGAMIGGKSVVDVLSETALLTIETRGPFRFDVDANLARFEIAPSAPPNQSNNIEVVRVAANGMRDTLISQFLEIGFEKNDDSKPNVDENLGGNGIRSLLATGPFVRLDSESDQLIAQGTSLNYAKNNKTGQMSLTFKGTPIDAVKERHRLKTADGIASELQFTSQPGKPNAKGQPTTITSTIIRGPGGMAFYDQATKENNTTATWTTSFVQVKEVIGEKELDKLTFDGGRFSDAKAGFDLSGDVLHLWLDGAASDAKSGTNQAVPYRLQAIRHVSLKSPEFVIEESDALSVFFRQAEPAKAKSAVAIVPSIVPSTPNNKPLLPNPTQTAQPATQAPPQPPNPLKLSARTVDAWVSRTSSLSTAKPGNSPEVKYELERAECIDRVEAHQAPADPKKNPKGLDLRSAKLSLERHSLKDLVGFTAHLFAAKGEFAELHHEDTSLAGPDILIDQLSNFIRVIGPGALKMPANGGLTGMNAQANSTQVVRTAGVNPPAAEAKSISEMNVEWTEGMEFKGADGLAVFIGKVQAKQDTTPISTASITDEPLWGKSFVLCHRLDIRFDRPVYFNQFNKKADASDAGPKVSQAICKPAPTEDASASPRTDGFVLFEDEQRRRDKSIVKRQRIRASSLDFRAVDKAGSLIASGPGEVRMLQMGNKESGRLGQPTATPTSNEQEMKLTLVTYQTRLRMDDRGGTYQEGVFEGDVAAYQIPTTDFDRNLDIHSILPERSTFLTSDEILKVSTYKPATGKPEQKMEAEGNAQFRTDQSHGRANRILYDGRIMTLDGSGSRLALIERLPKKVGDGTGQTGRKIEYDTVENRIKIIDGATGSFRP